MGLGIDGRPGARQANLNKRRPWTPRIRMRHSIPRKPAQQVATLWAGSQTRSGAAIHDEARRAAICIACHAFHLTADAANLKIFVGLLRIAMLVQASQGQSGSAHVVVLGNEKGGSGKSTTALHIAVALLKAGQRVATIDLDCRQQSFTHYINNRAAWARRTKLDLELPLHRCIKLGETMQVAENENSEFLQFMEAVSAVESSFDFIVIDTPGTDSYLMRLAHSMADTLVTPINDSFLDFDVLGTVDPANYAVTGES